MNHLKFVYMLQKSERRQTRKHYGDFWCPQSAVPTRDQRTAAITPSFVSWKFTLNEQLSIRLHSGTLSRFLRKLYLHPIVCCAAV